MEPLLSVIVPVYNVEDFLDQCLDSIVNQTYRNLEILVVDDGSTDGSGALCDQWAQRDARIRVIHQANGGLSAARNTALDVMSGELVMMVDSDDVLHPESILVLKDLLQQHHADIAVGGYIPFTGDKPEWPTTTAEDSVRGYNQQEALLAVLYQQGLTHSAWGRIYKSSLFDDIRYPVGRYYEDFAIIYPLLKKCQRVVQLNRPLYGYRQRENSILDIFSPKRADVIKIGEELEQYTLLHDSQYTDAARSRLLSAYFNILLLSQQDKTSDLKSLQNHCWQGIKRLRGKCLFNPQVRTKNKLGIIASWLGRRFLCNIIGRNYSPRP